MIHSLTLHMNQAAMKSKLVFIARITHLDAILWFLSATLSLGSLMEVLHPAAYRPNDFLPKEYVAYQIIPQVTLAMSLLLVIYGCYAFFFGKESHKYRWLEGQMLLWMFMILVHLSVLPMNVSVGFYGVFLGVSLASHRERKRGR